MADDIVLGGKQIPNPKKITPHLDTDRVKSTPKNTYMKGDVSNAAAGGIDHDRMNNFNPPTADLIPKHPVEDLFEMKGIRHQPGRSIPKDSPVISDN